MQNLFILLAMFLTGAFFITGIYWWALRETARRRLRSTLEIPVEAKSTTVNTLTEHRGVTGWLYRAGFRRPLALGVFLASTFVLFLLGSFIWRQLSVLGITDLAVDTVRSIPGGVGNVLVPFVLAIPWFFVLLLTLLPLLVVRAKRRQRVKEIEQDLPLLLDLLNTLAQAGIGFDAALDQILGAANEKRPLVNEFRIFQIELLAGRSRVDALKHLMRRVQIPTFNAFVSAVLQAEMMGSAMSETLKTQAIEIRKRRQEKARAAAMAIPTLLVLPMVIGFLPGIFIVLIGPLLFEAFGMLGQTLRGVSGQ